MHRALQAAGRRAALALDRGLAVHPEFWGGLLTWLNRAEGWAGPGLPAWLAPSLELAYPARRPVYTDQGRLAVDGHGAPRTTTVQLTGRVFLPPGRRDRPRPVVVYTHATSQHRDAVPSRFGGHEWLFGAAAAARHGWVVAMPDLPGLGGDRSACHPLCHRRSLAWAVLDALPAVVRRCRAAGVPLDGRVFLMGYSLGGYASLAAAREWEADPDPGRRPGGLDLAGTACLAAPLDLADGLRRLLLDPGRPYPHPFYLPMLVLGYRGLYGPLVDPGAVLAPDLLAPGPDGDLLGWADGSRDGLLVDAAIARRLGLAPGSLPLRRLLHPDLAAALAAPDFPDRPLGRILRENDLAGGWAPTRPILFGHAPDDRDLPAAGTRSALAALGRSIAAQGRDPAGLLAFRPLARPGSGVGHAGAALPGVRLAFRWIARQTTGRAPTSWSAAIPAGPDAPAD